MEYLEKAIVKYGKVLPGNVLKVGYFLNNQLDIKLLKKLGKEFKSNCKRTESAWCLEQ